MAINFKQKSGAKNPKNRKKQGENSNLKNNKSLGQHWLRDREILDAIAFSAEIEDLKIFLRGKKLDSMIII